MRFADCVIDLEGFELRCGGDVVDVEPQVFDVLAYLAKNNDRLVTKNELLDEVWGNRFVSDSALTTRIKSARKAVGDTGRDQRVIKTVHGRGYRFVAALDESPVAASEAAATGAGDNLAARVADAMSNIRGGIWGVAASHGPLRQQTIEQVHQQAEAAGALVGRGSAAGAGIRLFGCVVDALDELLQRDEALSDSLPAGVREELERVTSGGLPATRQRMFLSAREALVAAAKRRPTLLILDDLEFADADTRELIAHVSRLAALYPVGLVLSGLAEADMPAGTEVVALAGDEAAGDSTAATARIQPEVAEALRPVALGGPTFDLVEFRAATGLDAAAGDQLLDLALAHGVLEVGGGGYRFTEDELATTLADELPPHRRTAMHAATAARLSEGGAAPDRVLRHLLGAEDYTTAIPVALQAAGIASEAQLHREVLRLTDDVLPHATGPERLQLLMVRGGSLIATGSPAAVSTIREALAVAPEEMVPMLRAMLARAGMLSNDLATATEALDGLEVPSGHPAEGMVLLATGMFAFFSGELEEAQAAADAARSMALSADAPNQMLDVITLQGMISHNKGEWFDRLRNELRATRTSPGLAATIFDCHLCVAEYLLYGPTPYSEVVALATDLRKTAEESGAIRAVAFSWCVSGEAELLAGNLEIAREHLVEAVAMHRELAADSGTAHSLQRLAEVELASGNRELAEQLAREALPLARWSPLARHLVQRTYGTLIAAAPNADAALAVVDEAEQTHDGPASCLFCEVMLSVPSAVASAEGGRLDEARRYLMQAEASAGVWQGTAWQGAVTEAKGVLARAEGADGANELFEQAAVLFEQAGQPLDVERCREAID